MNTGSLKNPYQINQVNPSVDLTLQVSLASLPEEQALPLRQRALELVTERLPGVANPIIDIYQLRLMEPAALTQHVARLKGLSLHCEVRGGALTGVVICIIGRGTLKKKDLPFLIPRRRRSV